MEDKHWTDKDLVNVYNHGRADGMKEAKAIVDKLLDEKEVVSVPSPR